MPTITSGGGVSADTLYFTTEFSGDTELNTGRIYLGGTLMAKPSVWEELPEPLPEFAVDLGLPSGRLWADRNVGAENIQDYGDYFAWGETVPRGENWSADTPYDWAHAPFNNGSSNYNSGYFKTVSGTVCPGRVLASKYDAAHIIMGGNWRMPTSAEMQELYSRTNYETGTVEGVNGMFFINKSDAAKRIFMPFAGYRYNSQVIGNGSSYYVWSSYLAQVNTKCSWGLNSAAISEYNRYYGFAVRGVC